MIIDIDEIDFLFYKFNGSSSETISFLTFLQKLTPSIPMKLI